MSAKVASEFRRTRTKLNPGRHGGRVKAQPLIFEPGHKNIATLIVFLVTLFVGLGAGWLVGSALSSTSDPAPVEQARVATQTEQTDSVDSAPLNSNGEADAVKQAETHPPIIEEQSDKDEPRTHARRRAGSRRAYVTTAQAGEPIPLSVIKGKPLKKAFRQFKRVRVW